MRSCSAFLGGAVLSSVLSSVLWAGSCASSSTSPPILPIEARVVPESECTAVLEPAEPSQEAIGGELESKALSPVPGVPDDDGQVEIRANTVAVSDSWARALLEGKRGAAYTLDHNTAARVLRLLEHESGEQARALKLWVGDKRSGSIRVSDHRSFVQGYRYISIPGAKLPKPVIAVAETGEELWIEAEIEDERSVHLHLRLTHSELEPMLEHVAQPRPGERLRLEVPIVRREQVLTRTSLEPNRVLLLRRPGFAAGERWTFVEARITATPIETKPRP